MIGDKGTIGRVSGAGTGPMVERNQAPSFQGGRVGKIELQPGSCDGYLVFNPRRKNTKYHLACRPDAQASFGALPGRPTNATDDRPNAAAGSLKRGSLDACCSRSSSSKGSSGDKNLKGVS